MIEHLRRLSMIEQFLVSYLSSVLVNHYQHVCYRKKCLSQQKASAIDFFLKAVTVVPGTPDQIDFLRYVLDRFGRNDLPLGVFDMNAKPALSKFHLKIYDNMSIKESREVLDGSDVLLTYCDEKTILICGGPLKNVAKAIQTGRFKFGRLVVQGGFAGDNIVPKEKRLSKFNGRITCPTFNLGADIKATKIVLDYNDIKEKYFVSKNVCHGVLYTKDTHKKLEKNQR
ncbi:unnamed protein product [Rotaria sp. Silwood1]|nr:unnamed protein product [Rotaria sp. Silwood1]